MEASTTQTSFEKFGWVTKEEPLSLLNDPNLDLNIMILESTAPFFGYYADQPREDKPEHLYWVLDQYYTQEQLFRVAKHIKSKCYPNLDATPGNIFVAQENYHVIRMHNLKRYSQIHAVQELFENSNIKLKKLNRKIQNQMGMIYLCKFMELIPLIDGLYKGGENDHRGFFEIPEYLNWEEFRSVTLEVKFDTSLLFFDAARAAFMEKGEIIELVRIFREKLTIDQLREIRDRYLKVINQRK